MPTKTTTRAKPVKASVPEKLSGGDVKAIEELRTAYGDITAEAITVPEEFAKDNETRFIEPLSANFIKWIKYIKRREGSFQQVANLKRKWNKAKKSIGRDWPHDCLRHSYASYHFAEYNDAGLTAKNLGHPDSTLLRKDYNGAVTKAQAKDFWAILPIHCR